MEWKKRAVAALKDSIAHWERMANGADRETESPDAESCACCEAFYHSEQPCTDCPVRLRSGAPHCQRTPWQDAFSAFNELLQAHDAVADGWDDEGQIGEAEAAFREAAQREVDYLRETLRMVEAGEVTND